jgi:hypothetical protein
VYVCCWTETEEGDPEQIEINKCQSCEVPHNGVIDCKPPFPDPTAPPTTGENIAPGDTGVLEQPPTSSPFNPAAPLQGGVLEQLQDDQPPLFGRNEGAAQPTGGIEQPFTSIPFQQIPQDTVQDQDQPFLQSETPPTLSPLPTPPPPLPPPTQTGPTDAPQDNQDDGGLPTIKSQEDVPLGETTEQPSSSEDEGQNPTIIE